MTYGGCVIRNSDGTPWNWRRAAVGYPVLAVGGVWGFHSSFGLGWWSSAIATASGFALAALVWCWAYWRFGRRT